MVPGIATSCQSFNLGTQLKVSSTSLYSIKHSFVYTEFNCQTIRLVWFFSISIILGYLIANPVKSNLYTYIKSYIYYV